MTRVLTLEEGRRVSLTVKEDPTSGSQAKQQGKLGNGRETILPQGLQKESCAASTLSLAQLDLCQTSDV